MSSLGSSSNGDKGPIVASFSFVGESLECLDTGDMSILKKNNNYRDQCT